MNNPWKLFYTENSIRIFLHKKKRSDTPKNIALYDQNRRRTCENCRKLLCYPTNAILTDLKTPKRNKHSYP